MWQLHGESKSHRQMAREVWIHTINALINHWPMKRLRDLNWQHHCLTYRLYFIVSVVINRENQRLPGAYNRSPGSKLLSITTQLVFNLILVQHETILNRWTNNVTMFVSTRASEYVFKCISMQPSVTVTGNPGVGKTATMRSVALKMKKKLL
jgi:Cdc6-like AAA superfamily ATPase